MATWIGFARDGVALDQRGHGHGERRPGDVSREAFVADVVAAIEQLRLGPVVLVGQSMGANTALLVAAEHPELVREFFAAQGLEPNAWTAGSSRLPRGYVPRLSTR